MQLAITRIAFGGDAGAWKLINGLVSASLSDDDNDDNDKNHKNDGSNDSNNDDDPQQVARWEQAWRDGIRIFLVGEYVFVVAVGSIIKLGLAVQASTAFGRDHRTGKVGSAVAAMVFQARQEFTEFIEASILTKISAHAGGVAEHLSRIAFAGLVRSASTDRTACIGYTRSTDGCVVFNALWRNNAQVAKITCLASLFERARSAFIEVVGRVDTDSVVRCVHRQALNKWPTWALDGTNDAGLSKRNIASTDGMVAAIEPICTVTFSINACLAFWNELTRRVQARTATDAIGIDMASLAGSSPVNVLALLVCSGADAIQWVHVRTAFITAGAVSANKVIDVLACAIAWRLGVQDAGQAHSADDGVLGITEGAYTAFSHTCDCLIGAVQITE
jgi:hypothetical protein